MKKHGMKRGLFKGRIKEEKYYLRGRLKKNRGGGGPSVLAIRGADKEKIRMRAHNNSGI